MNTTPKEMLTSINEIIKDNKEKEKYNLKKELESIIAIINRITDIDIKEKSRIGIYSDARIIYSYITRKFTKATYNEIGKSVNKNHSTMCIAFSNYKGIYKTDEDFRRLADRCLSAYFGEQGTNEPKVEAIEDINEELLKCDHTKLLRVKNYVEKLIEHGN